MDELRRDVVSRQRSSTCEIHTIDTLAKNKIQNPTAVCAVREDVRIERGGHEAREKKSSRRTTYTSSSSNQT